MSQHEENPLPAPETDRFNVRFIALGAFIIFLVLFGAEKLVWKLVDSSTRSFLSDAIERVSAPNITSEQKDAIRKETLHRLAVPSIIVVGALVLLAPLGVGLLLGCQSKSLLSAPIAVLTGYIVTLAISQAVSLGALLIGVLYAVISILGSAGVKRLQKCRYGK
ncbi:MAG: hypothetical protein JXR76_19680 [Deltaproteobacteria bacterium]|nr:hypothetical protein [Deltaproteobacteria bacterium]